MVNKCIDTKIDNISCRIVISKSSFAFDKNSFLFSRSILKLKESESTVTKIKEAKIKKIM